MGEIFFSKTVFMFPKIPICVINFNEVTEGELSCFVLIGFLFA